MHAELVPGDEVHRSVVNDDQDIVEQCVAPTIAVGVMSHTAKLSPSTVSAWYPAATPFEGWILVNAAASYVKRF